MVQDDFQIIGGNLLGTVAEGLVRVAMALNHQAVKTHVQSQL